MAIPDFQTIMLPLLQYFGDGQLHSIHDAVENMASHFALSDEERQRLLPSGRQETFKNRLSWTLFYEKKAGLLTSLRRGQYQITVRGNTVLAQAPKEIDIRFLEQFPEFQVFRTAHQSGQSLADNMPESVSASTPEEALESAYAKLQEELIEELRLQLKGCSPAFFERLVVDVIVKLGYGGSRQDAGKALGRSGDEGIDGIIKEDKLGLDTIYIQAKRWAGVVGRPEIQKFVGALTGQRSRKGIFITTSYFSADAKDYVTNIDTKIVLIDGEMLTRMMIDHNVGVSTAAVYSLKKIDHNYFSEDDS